MAQVLTCECGAKANPCGLCSACFDTQYTTWAGDAAKLPGRELRELICREYNRVADACRAMTGSNRERLESLSLVDLAWFSAGKSLDYGRPPFDCLINGGCHTSDARSVRQYIGLLTTADPEGEFGPVVRG